MSTSNVTSSNIHTASQNADCTSTRDESETLAQQATHKSGTLHICQIRDAKSGSSGGSSRRARHDRLNVRPKLAAHSSTCVAMALSLSSHPHRECNCQTQVDGRLAQGNVFDFASLCLLRLVHLQVKVDSRQSTQPRQPDQSKALQSKRRLVNVRSWPSFEIVRQGTTLNIRRAVTDHFTAALVLRAAVLRR